MNMNGNVESLMDLSSKNQDYSVENILDHSSPLESRKLNFRDQFPKKGSRNQGMGISNNSNYNSNNRNRVIRAVPGLRRNGSLGMNVKNQGNKSHRHSKKEGKVQKIKGPNFGDTFIW